MHEAGLAEDLLKAALQNMPPGQKVKRIYVEAGKLLAVVPESLELYFSEAAKETPLAGTGLEVKMLALQSVCHNCRHEFEADDQFTLCPKCDSGMITFKGGHEISITGFDVE